MTSKSDQNPKYKQTETNWNEVKAKLKRTSGCWFLMAISDAVVSNLTTIYLAMIAAIKAYGLVSGRSFSGVCVLIVSTTAVGIVLVGTLAWDVSRKVKYVLPRRKVREICKGGICWHGVSVKSPASQVRFRIPQQQII